MKKTLAVLAVVALICSLAIGNTLAYLQDSKVQKNTFEVGNVHIQLTEAKVAHNPANGDIEAVSPAERLDSVANAEIGYGKLFPAQTVHKDPTIKNIGSEKAYMAAKIIVSTDDTMKLVDLLGTGYENLLGIELIMKGGLMNEAITMTGSLGTLPIYGNDNFHIFQRIETIGGKPAYVFYIFLEGAKATDYEQMLFEKIVIPETWGNEDMAKLKGLTIEVQAFAVQTNGFANCLTAMTTAFADKFVGLAGMY